MFGTESGALMFGPGICGGGGAYVVIGLVGYKSVAFYSCAGLWARQNPAQKNQVQR